MSAPTPSDRPPGRIVAFFSYKGGTGRSMALANVAWLLAGAGNRVLMMDWDFEAPGLHRYVHPFLSDPELVESPGLIDFFLEFATAAISVQETTQEWFQPYTALLNYTRSVDFEFPKAGGRQGYLDLIPAGRQDGQYSVRVNGFNWERFYTAFGGGIFLEAVKQKLRAEYDYILIDSRTGVSDTAGICTVQMPDELVACFTLNRQSIAGCAAVARSAASQRRKPDGGAGLRIWPVPTRIEDAEKDKRDRMQTHATRMFGDLLTHIPSHLQQQYWGEVGVRYHAFYAYEEVLSVFGDRAHTTGSMLGSMEAIARYLAGGTISAFEPMSEKMRLDGLRRYAAVPLLGAVETESTAPAAKASKFTFFISYAQADRDNNDHVLNFIDDLSDEMRAVGAETVGLWMDKDRVEWGAYWETAVAEHLQKADALLALISPRYVNSEWCGREFRLFHSSKRPIVPVVWVPVDSSPRLGLYDFNVGAKLESYPKLGLRRLMQIRRFDAEYFELISELVRCMMKIAGSADAFRPEGNPVRERIHGLAEEYGQIRRTMRSGRPRTLRMEEITAQMRELAAEGWTFIPELMDSEDPGERLVAIAMLQVRPAASCVVWLGEHVAPQKELPFVGYHAAVALRVAAQKLPVGDLAIVEKSIIKAQQGLPKKGDVDRDRTLKLALEEVQHRQSMRKSAGA